MEYTSTFGKKARDVLKDLLDNDLDIFNKENFFQYCDENCVAYSAGFASKEDMLVYADRDPEFKNLLLYWKTKRNYLWCQVREKINPVRAIFLDKNWMGMLDAPKKAQSNSVKFVTNAPTIKPNRIRQQETGHAVLNYTPNDNK